MLRLFKVRLPFACSIIGVCLIAACGGNSTNTVVVNTANPTIFYAHAVAFRNSTTVAWGFNGNGQLGNGNASNSSVPVVSILDSSAPILGMTGVATGGTHSLAFKNLSGVRAWGNNALGQLGDGTTTANSRAVAVKTSESGNPFLTGVVSVAAGGRHSLALRGDGSVWAWGYNGLGQLGDGTATNRSVAVSVVWPAEFGTAKIVSIAAGGDYSLACDDQGRVWSWGYNGSGQLGLGNILGAFTPQRVTIPDLGAGARVIAVAAGGSTSLALDDQGAVHSWGYNHFGQLATAPPTDAASPRYRTIPARIDSLSSIRKIAVGLDHCLALDASNTLWGWGYNGYGQLGRGVVPNVPEDVPNPTPQPVPGITGTILDIVAAGHSSLAITGSSSATDVKKGRVWTWGYNAYGQLGNGTTGNGNSAPAVVKGYETVLQ